MYPIYIPSKGRSDKCSTVNIFLKENIKFLIVVEPQDFENYTKIFGKERCIVLPENNKGIAYVRNFCKHHAVQNNQAYHWQIDDDIKTFQLREDGKNIKTAAQYIFNDIENFVLKYKNIGAAGLIDCVFAWTKKNIISFNQQICSAGLFNCNTNVIWENRIIEDTDYSLQLLLKNYCTITFNKYLYSKSPNEKASGGLSSKNITTHEEHRHNLVKKYPEHFKLKCNKDGVLKIAPSRVWSLFKQLPSS